MGSADRHLMIDDCMRLTRGPKESRARPAIAASAYGPRVIKAVLTGALDDGAAGLWAIKDRGVAFAQDPATAEHSSMSESAIAHVDVDFVGTVEAIVHNIIRAVDGEGEPAMKGTRDAQFETANSIAVNSRGMEADLMDLGKVSKYTCPDCHGVRV
jgi:two-component system chemotaxis response regulator CheB